MSINRELSVSEMDIVLKCAIYGIITSLLTDLYKARFNPTQIKDRYGFFASETDVENWTIEIFGMSPYDVIKLLISGDLSVDLVSRYGVKN